MFFNLFVLICQFVSFFDESSVPYMVKSWRRLEYEGFDEVFFNFRRNRCRHGHSLSMNIISALC